MVEVAVEEEVEHYSEVELEQSFELEAVSEEQVE